MKPFARIHQRGAFVVFMGIALSALFLLLALGMEIGTRLVVHTELKNAADACALAAAAELNNKGDALDRARAAGQAMVLNWHKKNFQTDAIATPQVRFSTDYANYADSTSVDAVAVECSITDPGVVAVVKWDRVDPGITPWTAQATSRAGLVPARKICAWPLAVQVPKNAIVSYSPVASANIPTNLLVLEWSGAALNTSAGHYRDLLTGSGLCQTDTGVRSFGASSVTPVSAVNVPAADAQTGIVSRLGNDPNAALTNSNGRKIVAVPSLYYDAAKSSYTLTGWECIELKNTSPWFVDRGPANDTKVVASKFKPPVTTTPRCLATGTGLGAVRMSLYSVSLKSVFGPYVPALIR